MNDASSKNILIIQTAFIGDTILASHFAAAVKEAFPEAKIHFFLRKGNESVIQGLPSIEKVWVWDKAGGKTRNLIRLISGLRKLRFAYVFNLHRHFNSGLVTSLMHSPVKVGFRQNPLSMSFDLKADHLIPHHIGGRKENYWHEVQRNLQLLKLVRPDLEISDQMKDYRPELPLLPKHLEKVEKYKSSPYFVVAPASVWFTKAWSESKYRELAQALAQRGQVFFIGASGDRVLCDRIREGVKNTTNLCGELNLLESAALMKDARRVFVNDSAPLHLASCVNARTTAIFCSTIPDFGYIPLALDSTVVDVGETLSCRPCGLHGHKSCPQGHFRCSLDIDVARVLQTIG